MIVELNKFVHPEPNDFVQQARVGVFNCFCRGARVFLFVEAVC